MTGVVMTKLDGTARGGVLVSLAEKYGIPVHFIGIGESAEDLRPFDAHSFARSLVGLDSLISVYRGVGSGAGYRRSGRDRRARRDAGPSGLAKPEVLSCLVVVVTAVGGMNWARA